MAEDTVELLRQLEIDRASVIGLSDGGMVGLDMAIHHPDRVTKLVVTGSNFRTDAYSEGTLEWLLTVEPEDWPKAFREDYERLSPDGPSHWPIVLPRIQAMWAVEPSYTVEEMASITAPTLVIAGDQDVITPEHSVALFRAIPEAQHCILPDTAHGALPNDVILTFLKEPEDGRAVTSARVSDPFRRLAALTGLLAASLLHDLSDLIPATSPPTRLTSMAMIPTQRLAMTPMSCEAMRAIMAADWQRAEGLLGTPFPTEWRNDGWGWLAPRVVEGDLDSRLLVWGTRLARLIDGRGQAVAEAGFHGPPDDDGWVEIGYRVVTGYRRRGFAEEACRGLLDWAFTQGVDGVRAAISPDNEASARLAQKLGFAHAGRARHEVLGEQLIFEHPRGSYGCLG